MVSAGGLIAVVTNFISDIEKYATFLLCSNYDVVNISLFHDGIEIYATFLLLCSNYDVINVDLFHDVSFSDTEMYATFWLCSDYDTKHEHFTMEYLKNKHVLACKTA